MEQIQHKMLLTVAHNMLTNSEPQEGALNRKLEEARGHKKNTKPPFPPSVTAAGFLTESLTESLTVNL